MSPDGLPSFAAHRGPRTTFNFCEQPVRNTAAPSPYLSLSYLHSEECRVEEELLTAVRDYRPDLLEQAQNDRTLRRLETPIVRLAKSLRIAGDDEGTESIVQSKKRRPVPRLLMLSTSRIRQTYALLSAVISLPAENVIIVFALKKTVLKICT